MPSFTPGMQNPEYANEWQRKSHFFYTIWDENAHKDYKWQYSDEQLHSYVVASDFIDFALACDPHGHAFQRVHEVSNALPTNPDP